LSSCFVLQPRGLHLTQASSEKKIDRIEDRLAGIENVLESLAAKLGSLDLRRDSTENSSQSRSHRRRNGISPGALDEAPTPAPFEGETTINTQSDYARELLAKAIGSTPSFEQNTEVKSALLALDDLVKRQGQVTSATTSNSQALINRALADVDPDGLEKPPWDVVTNVLDNGMSEFAPQVFFC
jgi:hypothetical protein